MAWALNSGVYCFLGLLGVMSGFWCLLVQNFSAPHPIDIILNENPVPIRDRMPALERNLAVTIDKALVRNPKDRFPDAGKLLAAIH